MIIFKEAITIFALSLFFSVSTFAAQQLYLISNDDIGLLVETSEWNCKTNASCIDGKAISLPVSFRFTNIGYRTLSIHYIQDYFLTHAKNTTSLISNLEIKQINKSAVKPTDFLYEAKCSFFDNSSSGYLVVYFFKNHDMFIKFQGDLLEEVTRNNICQKITSLITPLLKTKSMKCYIANENNQLFILNDDFSISEED